MGDGILVTAGSAGQRSLTQVRRTDAANLAVDQITDFDKAVEPDIHDLDKSFVSDRYAT